MKIQSKQSETLDIASKLLTQINNLRKRDHINCWRFVLSLLKLIVMNRIEMSFESPSSNYIILRLHCHWSLIVLDFVSLIVKLVSGHIGVVWNMCTCYRTFARPPWCCSIKVILRKMGAWCDNSNTICNFDLFCRVSYICLVVMRFSFERKRVIRVLWTFLVNNFIRTPILQSLLISSFYWIRGSLMW